MQLTKVDNMEFIRELPEVRQQRHNERRGNHKPSVARGELDAPNSAKIATELNDTFDIFDLYFGFAYMKGCYGR